jgi:phosphoribosyl 1,2-cyclic phosphodiesterase
VSGALRFRVVSSGSGGNATLVEAAGTRLLIDAGLGPRELAERLQAIGVDPASLAAVVLSHEHGDHARGVASFARRWGMPVVGTRGTYAAAGLGAVEIPRYDVVAADGRLRIGAIELRCVATPHDAAEPVAFVVAAGGVSLGHATDLGHVSRGVVEAFRSCDALLIESNYDPAMLRDGPYPWTLKERILSPRGHLSNADIARFLGDGLGAACGRLVLAHLSQKNNHPELALMSAETALRRRGRTEVAVEITGPEGTDWIALGPEPPAARGPEQLALF